jgi:hypothetical protein
MTAVEHEILCGATLGIKHGCCAPMAAFHARNLTKPALPLDLVRAVRLAAEAPHTDSALFRTTAIYGEGGTKIEPGPCVDAH